MSSEECDVNVFACISMEQADEFALIRESRDICGCHCGDLVKKVSKMHVKKLLSFLHERSIDTTGKSKQELMTLAKQIAHEEKNCSNSLDCECTRNGVSCHQDVCSGCRGNCFNPNDRYTYRKEEVHRYRSELLSRWRQETSSNITEPCVKMVSVV